MGDKNDKYPWWDSAGESYYILDKDSNLVENAYKSFGDAMSEMEPDDRAICKVVVLLKMKANFGSDKLDS